MTLAIYRWVKYLSCHDYSQHRIAAQYEMGDSEILAILDNSCNDLESTLGFAVAVALHFDDIAFRVKQHRHI